MCALDIRWQSANDLSTSDSDSSRAAADPDRWGGVMVAQRWQADHDEPEGALARSEFAVGQVWALRQKKAQPSLSLHEHS